MLSWYLVLIYSLSQLSEELSVICLVTFLFFNVFTFFENLADNSFHSEVESKLSTVKQVCLESI